MTFWNCYTPTKVVRTYGLGLLRYTMGPEVETASSELARPSEVTPSRHNGKSPITDTFFYSASSDISTSSIPPQPFPPPYIPFGTITTPPQKLSSVFETIATPRSSISITLPKPIPIIVGSTTITTI